MLFLMVVICLLHRYWCIMLMAIAVITARKCRYAEAIESKKDTQELFHYFKCKDFS